MHQKHCNNLGADRALGEYWEREFCKVAAGFGRSFTPHQIGRPKSAQAYRLDDHRWHPMTLPDITIWTRPGEHHEIKHKAPTRDGYFGLERYRLEALRWFAEETGQSVYYTIHDHSRTAGREDRDSNSEHWISCAVVELCENIGRERYGESYVNGQKKTVSICYWPTHLFQKLIWHWGSEPQRDRDPYTGIDPKLGF